MDIGRDSATVAEINGWDVAARAIQGLQISPAIMAAVNVASVTDPLGNRTTYTMDSAGRFTTLDRPGVA